MLGQLLCYSLESTFGYLLPAYQTYKTVEQEKEQQDENALKNWCIYWGIIGTWTICERILDKVLFWVPLYDELKVIFVVWLWYDRCKGAKFLYDNWLLPWLNKHQSTIDQHINDVKDKVFSLIAEQSSQLFNFAKTMFFRVLLIINQMHQQILQEEERKDQYLLDGNSQITEENEPATPRQNSPKSKIYKQDSSDSSDSNSLNTSSIKYQNQHVVTNQDSLQKMMQEQQSNSKKNVKALLKKRKANQSSRLLDKRTATENTFD
eukprot:TRINITY_DN12092_c0_g2_i4.p1 TRINITY_DN12092_c0_g2~~TRINITY_DN12092_c0_g2_i4.p1  ORF type:complete len:263 (+),score=23.91 TRINITY_DN12092_c0_g2_i4:258-1046(+)